QARAAGDVSSGWRDQGMDGSAAVDAGGIEVGAVHSGGPGVRGSAGGAGYYSGGDADFGRGAGVHSGKKREGCGGQEGRNSGQECGRGSGEKGLVVGRKSSVVSKNGTRSEERVFCWGRSLVVSRWRLIKRTPA